MGDQSVYPEDKQLDINSFLIKTTEDIAEIISRLYSWNWIDTTGGSVSVRIPQEPGRFALTPTHSGFRRWKTRQDGLVVLDHNLDLASYSTSRHRAHPSAMVHQFIYATFPKAHAILHSHAPYSLAFACRKKDIEPFTLQSQMLGVVPCIISDADEMFDRGTRFIYSEERRMTSGMQAYDYAYEHFKELLDFVKQKLGSRAEELQRHGLAFTIYRHGVFVIARNLDEAFDNLIRVERNCQVQILSRILDNPTP